MDTASNKTPEPNGQDARATVPVGRKLPQSALWEQLQRRAQPSALDFCNYFFAQTGPSLKAAKKWLEEHYGIKISINALSSFYNSLDIRMKWVSLRSQQAVETAAQELPKDLETATRQRIEQTMFEMSYADLTESQRLQLISLQQQADGMKGNFALKRAKLELDREKFEVQSIRLYLKWRKDRKMEELAEANLSQADKIAAMRQMAFADVDALQKSGEIQLPK